MTTEPQTGEPAPITPTSSPPPQRRRSGVAAGLMSLIRKFVVLAALAAAFWLGTRFAGPGESTPGAVSPGPTAAAADDIEYWTCSMHPQIRQSGPGRCPICGMELVPVKRTEEAAEAAGAATPAKAAKVVKYACAMMCVPPMDRPGKCPVCGMDMVPVEEHGGDEAPGGPSAANVLSEISLSETARKLARLQVTPVERRFAEAETRMVGKVDYDETRQRSITSRVAGRLDRLYVNFTGVPVNQGDHLVYLYSPELLSTQQELIQALNAFQELRPDSSEDIRRIRTESLDSARQKLLLWGITQEQVDEIEQRGTPSDHMTIYAPIGGIVTEKLLVEGEYVETGTEIYTIADLSSVWVKLDAYELDLASLRYGQEVEFTTEAYPGDVFHGKIAFIDPVLNARTRTAKVRVNVPNEDGRLKPEMFVRAVVRSQLTAEGMVLDPALADKWICPMHPEAIADGPEACVVCGMPLVPAESLGYATADPAAAEPPLVIPVTAPLITGKRAIVYVAMPDREGRYEGREVLLGPRAGDVYVVREGLAEGDLVVSQGNLYLDSAVQILAKRSMMQPEPGGAPPGGHAGHAAHAAPAEPQAAAMQPQERGATTPPAGGAVLPESAKGSLDRVFDAYFAMHAALSRDQLDPAKETAKSLLEAVTAFNETALPDALARQWRPLEPALRTSAEGVRAATTLPATRAAFEGVSNAMIAVAGRFGAGTRGRMLVYHCPMAFDNRGARWLQEKEGTENPYFGSAMFTCGVLKETIEAHTEAAGGGTHDE